MNRLGTSAVGLLTSPTRIIVSRFTTVLQKLPDGTEQQGQVQQPLLTWSAESQPSQEFARHLGGAFFDDRLYTGRISDAPFHPQLDFQIWSGQTLMDVALDFKTGRMNGIAANHELYEFIAGGKPLRLLDLMKKTFPNDKEIQALTPPSLAMEKPIPSDIPAAVLGQIQTIHAGMTRSELLNVFITEGGVSSRVWREYIYRESPDPQELSFSNILFGSALVRPSPTPANAHGYVKVSAEFAPRDTELLWVNGKGFAVDQNKLYSQSSSEQPDDVITYISPPYWGWMIAD